jgi:hypothetical protein
MKGISRRTVSLAAIVSILLGVWGYGVFDERTLEETVRSAAKEKLDTVIKGIPPKKLVDSSLEITTWRTPPVLGQPAAKAVVSVQLRLATGAELTQSYDYYFKREGHQWVEDNAGHSHAGHTHGEGSSKSGQASCH